MIGEHLGHQHNNQHHQHRHQHHHSDDEDHLYDHEDHDSDDEDDLVGLAGEQEAILLRGVHEDGQAINPK